MNKAIKLSNTHYIVVEDSEIKEGDLVRWVKDWNVGQRVDSTNKDWSEWGKITHSTEPLEPSLRSDDNTLKDFVFIKPLSLSEVEEAINGYSVEKMSDIYAFNRWSDTELEEEAKFSFKEGFKAHQELVKDKLFTVNDMENMFILGGKHKIQNDNKFLEKMNEIIQSLLPKTEWNIEFDEQGKIKLI